MPPERMRSGMVVLSIVYGLLVAIFAVMSVDFLGSFAAVGGIVVGGLWAITGYLGAQQRSR
ncbi:MAG: hypothetical protein ABW219_16940 [Ilumatobacteraceae bacterium]